MGTPTCELIINATPNDFPILSRLASHIIRQCAFPFSKKTLAVDYGRRRNQYVTSNANILSEESATDGLSFLNDFDDIIEIHESSHRNDDILYFMFGTHIAKTHDHRGGPVYQYLLPIFKSDANYICHFDCDILLYSSPGFSWVAEGIELLRTREDIFSVAPHSGPPCEPSQYNQPGNEVRHEGALRLVNCLSTRKFLFDRAAFMEMTPLKPRFSSRRDRLMSLLPGRSALLPLETHITQNMRHKGLWRADLPGETSWSLHCREHTPKLLVSLNSLIELVERGIFPDTQKGQYDLILPLWRPFLEGKQA